VGVKRTRGTGELVEATRKYLNGAQLICMEALEAQLCVSSAVLFSHRREGKAGRTMRRRDAVTRGARKGAPTVVTRDAKWRSRHQ